MAPSKLPGMSAVRVVAVVLVAAALIAVPAAQARYPKNRGHADHALQPRRRQ